MHIQKKPLPESNSTMQSKLMALAYGILCIGIAFIGKIFIFFKIKFLFLIKIYMILAQYLGGILQASLTIFGVVGGPLFGLFSLGMFIPRANQRVL